MIVTGFHERKMVYYIQLGTLETEVFPFGLNIHGHYKTEEEAVKVADLIDDYMTAFAKRKR